MSCILFYVERAVGASRQNERSLESSYVMLHCGIAPSLSPSIYLTYTFLSSRPSPSFLAPFRSSAAAAFNGRRRCCPVVHPAFPRRFSYVISPARYTKLDNRRSLTVYSRPCRFYFGKG